MIDLSTLLTYAAVVLGIFLIPGPAVLLTIARATVSGRRVGVATAFGIAFGDLIHTTMAAFGLSAILMTSAIAFSIVKFAGAAYLICLGVRAMIEKSEDLRLAKSAKVDAPRAFRQAVMAELVNPKTALFFLAFLPQFVHPRHGPVILQLTTLGLVFVAMSAVYVSMIALAAGSVSRWLNRHREIGRRQGKVIGAIYILLGVRLALQER